MNVRRWIGTSVCFSLLMGAPLLGCGEDTEEQASGTGTVLFTTWGEEYIEEEIPAAPPADEGIVDGWTVKYEKFLVVLGGVTVGNSGGTEAARMSGSKLFDMHVAGEKTVASFDVPAKAWDAASFVIGPADDATVLGEGATQEDLDAMKAGGYSLHVKGSAIKDGVTKAFDWSFQGKTLYRDCKAEVDGKEVHGVVVTQGGMDTAQLTIHGDHFFYDDLEAASAERRFDAIACADANGDGDVTLEELGQASLLPDANATDEACMNRPVYKPGSQPVNDLRAFVTALSRTVGHYRGEGECISEKID